MNIVHLIPNLQHTGAAAQLGLLLKHAPVDQRHRVCCIESEGPWAQRLRDLGITVDCLHWKRVFDPAPPWQLHRLLRNESPDCIHVWGLPALRALGLIGRRWLARTLVCRPLPRQLKQLRSWDRWLLRRVRGVAASHQDEASQCVELGIPGNRISVIPPGIEAPQIDRPAEPTPSARNILCVGELERHKGWRDAVWALDILRYVYPDIRLKVVGAGPLRSDLQWFATRLEAAAQVDFLGAREDVPTLLKQAGVFWAPAPSLTHGQVVLEAMAAGRPVVAAAQPAVRAMITDGVTGYLVAPGDKVALSKRTRGLILEPALANTLGEAARRHVAQHFSAAALVGRWSECYALK